MTVALVSHRACLAHDTGPGHPERPERLVAVLDALGEDVFPALDRHDAPVAPEEAIVAVHDAAHVAAVLSLALAADQLGAFDADTIVSAGSREAALRAAGGAMLGVDLVLGGKAEAAFVAVRPPGHHATAGRAMGFCLFNNVAIAAHHARSAHGLDRVVVADFDVHHGNGTQDMFWAEQGPLFLSSHQSPCYPGTGERHERGAHSNVVNAPLPPGSGSEAFRRAWREQLLPALDEFAPQLLIISAGFDAHRADPLAQLSLDEEDFAWITRELVATMTRHAPGRIVSLLEGGYDLTALAASAAAHVHALEGTR